MSRTYRNRWESACDCTGWCEHDWHLVLNRRARDVEASSHRRKRVRCMCQYPKDKWHKKRRRRAMRAGATPKEAERAME